MFAITNKLFVALALLSLAIAPVVLADGDDATTTASTGSVLDRIRMKAFEAFMKLNNKSYTGDELAMRFGLFNKRMDDIDAWNQKFADGEVTYSLGVNKFIDMTLEELQSMYGMVIPDDLDNTLPAPGAQASDDDNARALGLPQSIDWRLTNCITAIRNQGQCGSCYAFAVADAIAISKCWNWNETVFDHSPQQIVDCGRASGKVIYGCQGGWPPHVMDWFNQKQGLAAEVYYPYTSGKNGQEGSCRYDEMKSKNQLYSTGYTNPTPKYKQVTNDDDFKYNIAYIGPVISVVNASDHFNSYSGGMFDEPTCLASNGQKWNHAVLIIGYGVENGVNYWLVRNQWDTWWGDKGYMKIKQGQCEIGKMGWVLTK